MSAITIGIVDYGMGNHASVTHSLHDIGFRVRVSKHPEKLDRVDALILPGVGAFPAAMKALSERELVTYLQEQVKLNRPLIGICLGMQLLFERSDEGDTPCLGILGNTVVQLRAAPGVTIPHMGWNAVSIRRPAPIFTDLPSDSYFYFVHSYYAVAADTDVVAGETPYPDPFCSVVWRDNVYATQFHPEKSQRDGLRILANFASLD